MFFGRSGCFLVGLGILWLVWVFFDRPGCSLVGLCDLWSPWAFFMSCTFVNFLERHMMNIPTTGVVFLSVVCVRKERKILVYS